MKAIIENLDSGWKVKIDSREVARYDIGDAVDSLTIVGQAENEEWVLVCRGTKNCECDSCTDLRAMEPAIKIKDKGLLKNYIYCEGFDKIAIWADGNWSDVGSGYGGEMDGNNPECYISRVAFHGLTRREINNLIKFVEAEGRTPESIDMV
jgi:hypothetical protein